MTVQQLIEALQQMPSHHFVVAYQRAALEDACAEDFSTEVVEVRPLGHGVVLLEAE